MEVLERVWRCRGEGCRVRGVGMKGGCRSGQLTDLDAMVYHIPQPVDHDSMESLKMMDNDPIDLYQCLKAFVRDDELGEEECWSVSLTTCNSILECHSLYCILKCCSVYHSTHNRMLLGTLQYTVVY